ncbi:MAG TPA: DUF2520 domain-containing protein [Candidatus Dormibacteraeota bacterium]|nr:DUF2520 domain-containing protein [Candidatus Dormibacteraeota bacterium]
MISSVRVVGTGRAGGAIAARLTERGLSVQTGRETLADADLVLLAVPDAAISEVAQRVPIGPWVAHVSGATSLDALAPHDRRFSVHPLQTLSRERGPQQLDGAWAAVTAETDEASTAGTWLAETLGLRAFPLADADKPLYHAGAAMASNFLVTLYRAAARLLEETDAPPEALVPLMTRTIENGFALTGPIARGDWSTVEAHLRALEARAPDLVPLYRALAEATRP